MKKCKVEKSDLGPIAYQSPRARAIELDLMNRICNISDPEPTEEEIEPAF